MCLANKFILISIDMVFASVTPRPPRLGGLDSDSDEIFIPLHTKFLTIAIVFELFSTQMAIV